MYMAHPYGKPVIGWMSEVMKLTLDDALSFYRAYYTPANAVVVVAGDVKPDEVRRLSEKYYGVLPNTASPPARKRTEEPEPIAARRIVMSDGTSTLRFLDPQTLTVQTVPARIARQKRDPWAGYAEVRQALTKSVVRDVEKL